MNKALKFKKILSALTLGIIIGIVTVPVVAWNSSKLEKEHTNKNKQNLHQIPNVNIAKPSYQSLDMRGFSGSAKMNNPPKSTLNFNVSVSRMTGISNGDIITITYHHHKKNGTVNGKVAEIFTYTVSGLQKPATTHNITVVKPVINLTGINGSGSFILPVVPNAIITTTANIGSLSNGDPFSITIRGKSTYSDLYTINNKTEEIYSYIVSNLTMPIIDLTIKKPNLTFTGIEGNGNFIIPTITNAKVSTTANNGHLKTGDLIVITLSANKNYTINNGQQVVTFNYSVPQLQTKPSNVIKKATNVVPYDVNTIKVETVIERSGQKAVIGYFGDDYKKSPTIFTSNYIQYPNNVEMTNAGNDAVPYIKESEMKKFIIMYFKYIIHGPEIPTIGVVSIDNLSLYKVGTNGWHMEDGLVKRGSSLKYKPDNTSKGLINLSSYAYVANAAASGNPIDWNNLEQKFETFFNLMQHEYGHNMTNYQGLQIPSFITNHPFQSELQVAGVNNGYLNSFDNNIGSYGSKYYLSSSFAKKLATMFDVDVTQPNNKSVELMPLLMERDRLLKAGKSVVNVEKNLGLWWIRTVAGVTGPSVGGPYANTFNKDKSFLWSGQNTTEKFNMSIYLYSFSGSNFKIRNYKTNNGYSNGYLEMLTRMLVLMTNKNKKWYSDAATFMSLITGMNPFYKYKNGSLNLSNTYDTSPKTLKLINPRNFFNYFLTNFSNWNMDNTIQKIPSKTNPKIIFQGSATVSAIIEYSKNLEMRVNDLNVTKRDRMINFYKNDILGYGKAFSFYTKVNQSGFDSQTAIQQKNPNWSLNLMGGWTPKLHQYLIFNNNISTSAIANSKSIAFPIMSAYEEIAFRKTGSESWKTRTKIYNKYKAWYVDASDQLYKTTKTFREIQGRTISFWDDLNNNNHIDSNEITPIHWTNARSFFQQSGKIFPSGFNMQNVRFYGGTSNGEILTSGIYDANYYYTFNKTNNGYIKLDKEVLTEAVKGHYSPDGTSSKHIYLIVAISILTTLGIISVIFGVVFFIKKLKKQN